MDPKPDQQNGPPVRPPVRKNVFAMAKMFETKPEPALSSYKSSSSPLSASSATNKFSLRSTTTTNAAPPPAAGPAKSSLISAYESNTAAARKSTASRPSLKLDADLSTKASMISPYERNPPAASRLSNLSLAKPDADPPLVLTAPKPTVVSPYVSSFSRQQSYHSQPRSSPTEASYFDLKQPVNTSAPGSPTKKPLTGPQTQSPIPSPSLALAPAHVESPGPSPVTTPQLRIDPAFDGVSPVSSTSSSSQQQQIDATSPPKSLQFASETQSPEQSPVEAATSLPKKPLSPINTTTTTTTTTTIPDTRQQHASSPQTPTLPSSPIHTANKLASPTDLETSLQSPVSVHSISREPLSAPHSNRESQTTFIDADSPVQSQRPSLTIDTTSQISPMPSSISSPEPRPQSIQQQSSIFAAPAATAALAAPSQSSADLSISPAAKSTQLPTPEPSPEPSLRSFSINRRDVESAEPSPITTDSHQAANFSPMPSSISSPVPSPTRFESAGGAEQAIISGDNDFDNDSDDDDNNNNAYDDYNTTTTINDNDAYNTGKRQEEPLASPADRDESTPKAGRTYNYDSSPPSSPLASSRPQQQQGTIPANLEQSSVTSTPSSPTEAQSPKLAELSRSFSRRPSADNDYDDDDKDSVVTDMDSQPSSPLSPVYVAAPSTIPSEADNSRPMSKESTKTDQDELEAETVVASAAAAEPVAVPNQSSLPVQSPTDSTSAKSPLSASAQAASPVVSPIASSTASSPRFNNAPEPTTATTTLTTTATQSRPESLQTPKSDVTDMTHDSMVTVRLSEASAGKTARSGAMSVVIDSPDSVVEEEEEEDEEDNGLEDMSPIVSPNQILQKQQETEQYADIAQGRDARYEDEDDSDNESLVDRTRHSISSSLVDDDDDDDLDADLHESATIVEVATRTPIIQTFAAAAPTPATGNKQLPVSSTHHDSDEETDESSVGPATPRNHFSVRTSKDLVGKLIESPGLQQQEREEDEAEEGLEQDYHQQDDEPTTTTTTSLAVPTPTVTPGASPMSDSSEWVDYSSGSEDSGSLTPQQQTPQTTMRATSILPTLKTELDNENDSDVEVSPDDVSPINSGSDSEEEVNWTQLQETEAQTPKTEQDDDSTALLLAKLEEENAKFSSERKGTQSMTAQAKARRSRPPSMAQLRNMVTTTPPPSLRYSKVPPPPMTDLEFYAALVKDYQQTATRLPTLLSKKIRKGVPPPLRGVVWQSMSGARSPVLEDVFDQLSGESSPHEPVIFKDLGRSFPGVDMFRDPDGDGQRMLGRVLNCYSLYEPKVGYCQGLAFIVGPLLMHMPDKQAFCVLVRLMERYELQTCFLPDLPGLHVRLHQFRQLLKRNLPALSNHLDSLELEPAAYATQWFLSFFAITAPLPMLFRMFDVIFAEGVNETLMRVALSLMRKNQARLLAFTELEDALQLLLSRSLWDLYQYNADEFVYDFVSLSGDASREKLDYLQREFRDLQSLSVNANDAQTLAVTTAATSFLGHIWTSKSRAASIAAAAAAVATTPTISTTPTMATTSAAASSSSTTTKTTPATLSSSSKTLSFPPKAGTLSPTTINGAPVSRPLSMLRRSTSKQSLASTLNSVEASSASVVSTSSTAATSLSRDSNGNNNNAEDSSRSAAVSANANSNTATTTAKTGRSDSITPFATIPAAATTATNGPRPGTSGGKSSNNDDKYLHSQIEDLVMAMSELQRNQAVLADQLQKEQEEREEDKQAVQALVAGLPAETLSSSDSVIVGLVDQLCTRFGSSEDQSASRRQSLAAAEPQQSKAQLQQELNQAKDRLVTAASQSQEYAKKVSELDQVISSLKEQLRESHVHARNLHQDKQRLEKQVHNLRTRVSGSSTPDHGSGAGDSTAGGSDKRGSATLGSGLRELRLGRSDTGANGGSSGSGSKPVPLSPTRFGRSNNRTSSGGASIVISAPPTPTKTAAVAAAAAAAEAQNSETEALLMQLVQAKTAEAMARQEADEARQELERFRRAHARVNSQTSSINMIPTTAAAADRSSSATTSTTNTTRVLSSTTPPVKQPVSSGFFGNVVNSNNNNNNNASPPPTAQGAPPQAPAGQVNPTITNAKATAAAAAGAAASAAMGVFGRFAAAPAAAAAATAAPSSTPAPVAPAAPAASTPAAAPAAAATGGGFWGWRR